MTQGAGQEPTNWRRASTAGPVPPARFPAGPTITYAHPWAPAQAPAPVRAQAHPGNALDAEGDTGDGYTPTQRDLPVIGSGARAVQPTPTVIDTPSPAPADEDPRGPLYVVGDVHGYLDELREALRGAGLTDAEDRWTAGNARLWFLGDFTDRGPDGVGVIDLVMRLSAEAAAAGGYCKALLGNHELLIIGAKRFGDTPVDSRGGTASFQATWLLNGGQRGDMERLQEHHVQWMSRLDAMTLADDHLLLHSDATAYREYGETISAVNDAITEALERRDPDETWELFRKFTKRFAFRDEESGPRTARELMAVYGGRRIVHGHSPIPYLTGETGGLDDDADGGEGPRVDGPHVYADGLAIAMDGGITMAGRLLVSRLPLPT